MSGALYAVTTALAVFAGAGMLALAQQIAHIQHQRARAAWRAQTAAPAARHDQAAAAADADAWPDDAAPWGRPDDADAAAAWWADDTPILPASWPARPPWQLETSPGAPVAPTYAALGYRMRG